MKRTISLLLVLALSVLTFTACGSSNDAADSAEGSANGTNLTVLKVGASATPHAEILNAVKDTLAEEGVDLQVVEYTDYIIPNTSVESGELDANFFQHITYMNDFNVKNDTHLVSVASVHYEPMGIYPGKSNNLENIQDGATIAIPNDGTNETRALMLLEAQGLITLPEAADTTETTPKDILENPHNLQFMEVEAAAVARSLQDVDFGVINGNYALEAGFTDADGLVFEASDSDTAIAYTNVLAVKEGSETNEAIQKLVAALTSDECKAFIEETYHGMVLPVF